MFVHVYIYTCNCLSRYVLGYELHACTSVVGQKYNFKIWRQTNCAILKLESRLKTMFWPEKQNFLGIKLPNHMDVKSYGCQVIWVLHRNNQDGRKTPYVLIELTVNQVWKWQIDGYLHLKWEQRGLGRNEGSLHQVLYIHFYGSFLLSLLLNQDSRKRFSIVIMYRAINHVKQLQSYQPNPLTLQILLGFL